MVSFKLRIEPEETTFRTPGFDSESSEDINCQPDLLPVPPLPDGPRKWGKFHLLGYWIAEAFGIRLFIASYKFTVASSAVAGGLSPGATIGAVFLGHVLVSIACACNGWVGATYGINFPVYARGSFGIRGTAVAVVCRAVAAIVWFGTQTYQGGQCVHVMLRAIWPSFKAFPNHLPASAHVTSSQLLCFLYVFLLPLLWIHISKLRYLFAVKVVIMPIFGFALFGWAVGRAHGFGPVFSQGTHVSGTPTAIVFFSAMTSAIAPKATLALNIADFTRYAKSPRDVVWTNIFSLAIPVTLCAILGVVVTSATQVIYGVSTWNPLQVAELWDSRAAQFFAAFCWALAVIATNISANSTAVGNDLAILFPSYINVRRGQYLCAIIGVAACPWIVQNSAKSFTSFLGGYSIFLAPVAGILLSDFYILRRRYMDIPSLYRKGSSPYWYTCGFNFRAIVAFTLTLIPSLPGFAANVNTNLHIPPGASYVFSVVWPVGVVLSAALYLLFNFIWPTTSIIKPDASLERSVADEKKVDPDINRWNDLSTCYQFHALDLDLTFLFSIIPSRQCVDDVNFTEHSNADQAKPVKWIRSAPYKVQLLDSTLRVNDMPEQITLRGSYKKRRSAPSSHVLFEWLDCELMVVRKGVGRLRRTRHHAAFGCGRRDHLEVNICLVAIERRRDGLQQAPCAHAREQASSEDAGNAGKTDEMCEKCRKRWGWNTREEKGAEEALYKPTLSIKSSSVEDMDVSRLHRKEESGADITVQRYHITLGT
ncbi:hypothetical protein EW146_g7628 [Bondarzewia mesenterica]|uniref:Uncharacterized protein n=1 Tax=Bondarzewia mesenterica TaxID=1095465 RepID=A0A4S4LKU9_9AGAM|nr:hypothetical protein EW146_g7628 [Bondarzewia mesenterica]